MKILVTGAAGFSARHLIEYLRGASSAEICCSSLKAVAEKNWFPCELTNEDAPKVFMIFPRISLS